MYLGFGFRLPKGQLNQENYGFLTRRGAKPGLKDWLVLDSELSKSAGRWQFRDPSAVAGRFCCMF